MFDDDDLKKLARSPVPAPSEAARAKALAAAMTTFDENPQAAPQGNKSDARLTSRAIQLWREMMSRKFLTSPAMAGLVALPIVAVVSYGVMQERGGLAIVESEPAIPAAPAQPTVANPAPVAAPAPAAPAALPPPSSNSGAVAASRQAPAPLAVPAPVDAAPATATPGSTLSDEGLAAPVPGPVQEPLERVEICGSARADSADCVEAGGAVRYGLSPDSLKRVQIPLHPRSAETSAAAQAPAETNKPSGADARSKGEASNAAGAQDSWAIGPDNRPGEGGGLYGNSVAENEMARNPDSATPQPDRDRVEEFKSSAVKTVAQEPVSTFSIDVDTASYAMVRRELKQGQTPAPDSVRVEEMINYFPYAWKGPESREDPFRTTVAVMPTPWNQNTKLMHVAIKGYDVQQAAQPKANLVFLIDVSGSMNEADKLPLLKTAFWMLLNKLRPDDTVSIVTYAGNAGTVLEPTKASDKSKIFAAIEGLSPGGSTAGEAGIREAYRLARQSFVKDGVNRVMLATDGDFNVGQTDDDDLKRLIEQERKSGVFLSVFGFGQGNLNDQMMQTIAQNGNGTAAYIDTLQEAEKALVQEAGSTLFPIAKDVKIQVEFNPAVVSEYRLIGYETRALAREDFNNDRVDAGEIGSGHSVTAIYEITPKGSPAQMVDDLRYKQQAEAAQGAASQSAGKPNSDEYAFVKIRYKAPDGDVSKLLTQPVTKANEVDRFDEVGLDQRFTVAVAAFGQKLRQEAAVDAFGYDKVIEIANGAKGDDPFGYRSEFVGLVRLAQALAAQK